MDALCSTRSSASKDFPKIALCLSNSIKYLSFIFQIFLFTEKYLFVIITLLIFEAFIDL